MSQWESLEDVEKDLFEYSHLEYPGKSLTAAPPKSISEYRARTQSSRNPGLFDEEPEMREIFISGRGKHHPGYIIRPGESIISTPEEDMDIRRKIREVSGLGYSNEIIEKLYGQDESPASDYDVEDAIALPNLKLRPYKPIHKEKSDSTSKNIFKKTKKHSEGKKTEKSNNKEFTDGKTKKIESQTRVSESPRL